MEELKRSQARGKKRIPDRAAVLAGINRIFREVLFCETEEQLGRVCLDAATELTGSKFGFICEGDQAGSFQTIAISQQEWPAAPRPRVEVSHLRPGLEVRGIPGRVIQSGESLICNDPASHPDWLPPPTHHPPVTSFLGVPLKRGDQTFGMIGLANRPGGYDQQNQEDVETLAVAMVEALMRKRAEWKLAQLRRHHELILSSASEGILGLDLDGNMTFVNPAAAQMLGYEVEELLGKHAHTVWHHTKPDGSPYPPAECRILETLRAGVHVRIEDDHFWRKNGTGFPVKCGRNPIVEDGRISGAVVTFQDVTKRNRVEEALRQSEEIYRQIVETALEGIWIINAENKILFANSRIMEMLGYSLDEVIGKPLSRFMDQEWLENANNLITEHLRKGVNEHLDFKFRHKDGRELWVIMTASPIFDPQGRYAGSLGMVTDITARKHAEVSVRQAKAALEEQEQFLSSIFESIQDGISILDPELNILRVNRAKERDHAYALPLVGKKCYAAFHGAGEPCALCPVRRTLQTGQADQEVITTRLSGKDGLRHLNFLTFPLIDQASGIITGVVEYARDITEQVKAEEALRESEKRFRDITENAVEWIWEVDPEGKYTYSSPVVEKLLGYPPEEVLGKYFYDFFLPEEREKLKDAALAAFGAKQPFRDFLNRHLRKNGEIIWVSTSGSPVLDGAGNLLGYRGADSDITVSKLAEESLRESEAKYRLLVNQIPAVVFKGYADWSIDFYDNKVEAITGYSKADFDSRKLKWQELILPEDLEAAKRKFIKALKTDKSYVREYRIQRKDGQIRWIQDLGQIFSDAYGKIDYVSGVFFDTTDQKQAQVEIARLASFPELAPNPVLEVDTQGNITFANPAAHEVAQKLGLPDLQVFLPTNLNKILRTVDGERKKQVWRQKHLGERVFAVNISVVPQFQVGRLFFIDITERKKAEEEIRTAAHKWRTTFDAIGDAICLIDSEDKIQQCNQALADLVGRPFPEIIGRHYWELLYAIDELRDSSPLLRMKKSGKRETLSLPFGERWLYAIADPILNEIGAITGAVLIITDITKIQFALEQITSLSVVLTVIKDMNEALLRVKGETELFQRICDLMIEIPYNRFTWIGLVEPGSFEVKPVAWAGHEDGYLSVIKVTWDDSSHGRGPIGMAIKTGQPGIVEDIDNDHRFRPWRQQAHQRGYASCIAFPLIYENKTLGSLNVYAEKKNAFRAEELEFLKQVAVDIAVGVKSFRLEQELAQRLSQLEAMMMQTIEAIASMAEMRDPYTAGHQRRVTQLALALAQEMGLASDRTEGLRVASLIHDIGKIVVPAEILSKPGKISDYEMHIIGTHAQAGYDILNKIDFPWPVAQIIKQHHERLDGSGYPDGLQGKGILLEARILAVADVVEAMASHRPYRESLGMNAALEEISRYRGTLFDSQVVDACLKLFQEKNFKFS